MTNKEVLSLVCLLFSIPLRCFQYTCLTFIVLPLVVTGLFIKTSSQSLSLEFIRFFAFIDPRYARAQFSVNGEDLMHLFAVISFLIFCVSSVFRMLLEKLFGKILVIPSKVKPIVIFSLTTIIYVAALCCVQVKSMEQQFYFVFAGFYVMSCCALLGYFFLDFLLDKLSRITPLKIGPFPI